MTWTYSSSDISTDLAKVRLRLGDTNTNKQQFTDEEIDYFLDVGGSVIRAAILLCKAAIAKYARDVDHSNQGISTSRSALVQHYKDLIEELEAESNMAAIPSAPSLSQANRETYFADSDNVQPVFDVDTDTNNG